MSLSSALSLAAYLCLPILLTWLYHIIPILRRYRNTSAYERWVTIPLLLPFIWILAVILGIMSVLNMPQLITSLIIALISCITGIHYMYALSKNNGWILAIALVYLLTFYLFSFLLLLASSDIK